MRSFLREPLVLFLLLGGLLFLLFAWRGGGTSFRSNRIVITPGLIQHLSSGFMRTWQRAPTQAELKALIDEHVKEEIATREAMAMGLDQDDAVIRRRLRQKLEFLTEDIVAQAAPTEAQLQAWVNAHPDLYRGEARVALRQVFVSPDRRGARARADAEKLLGRLRAAGPRAATETLGDPTMLPAELPLGPQRDVSRVFGEDFARKVFALEPGRWAGPIESPYGLHLVLVFERADAPAPDLAVLRPLAERDLLADRQKQELDALYRRLLEKYTVVVELPKVSDSTAAAGVRGAR